MILEDENQLEEGLMHIVVPGIRLFHEAEVLQFIGGTVELRGLDMEVRIKPYAL